MSGYTGKAPDGATDFEAAFGLKPLGDNLEARVARAERLLGLFATAALDPASRRANIWVGSFAPSKVDVPVPDADVLEGALDDFRSPDELAERATRAEYMHLYDENA